MGDIVFGEIVIGRAKRLIARAQQVQEGLGRRRIELGKFLRRLQEALVARQIF